MGVHLYFCNCCFGTWDLQVDREFIEDNFNLYGLRGMVHHYNEALDVILDIQSMDDIPSDRQVSDHDVVLAAPNIAPKIVAEFLRFR